MAIDVAGRRYRKRNDIFYVNGKRVTDGWVNGIRVYPEDDGDYSYFLKLGGHVTGSVFRGYGTPNQQDNPTGTCDCTVSIKSKRKLYLAVLNQYQPETSLGLLVDNQEYLDEIPVGDVMVDILLKLSCPALVPKVHVFYRSNFPWGSSPESYYPTPDAASIISRLSTYELHTGYIPLTSVNEYVLTAYSSDASYALGEGRSLHVGRFINDEILAPEIVGGSSISCRFGTYAKKGYSFNSDRDSYRTGVLIWANNLEYYEKDGEVDGPFSSGLTSTLSREVLSAHLGTVMYGKLKRIYSSGERFPLNDPSAHIRQAWEVEEGGTAQSVYPMSQATTATVTSDLYG